MFEERQILGAQLPALAELLNADLLSLEGQAPEVLAGWFKQHGAPGFMVPKALGGLGGELTDLTPIFRAVGAACPSLGIMMLMHHHTVAAFCLDDIPIPARRAMLRSIAVETKLIASAFAESRPGIDLLDSSVECRRQGAGFVLNGDKKPCTLSHLADFFLVGVAAGEGEQKSRGLVLVDRGRSRVRVEPFWSHRVFQATDSHCVQFRDTQADADHVLVPDGIGSQLVKHRFVVSQSEVTISCVFQLLMASMYLGVASRLCELALSLHSQQSDRWVHCAALLDASCQAQYQLAQQLDRRSFSSLSLGRAMALSYSAARNIDALLEGVQGVPTLLENAQVAYLAAASKCIHRHPPSAAVRTRILADCYHAL